MNFPKGYSSRTNLMGHEITGCLLVKMFALHRHCKYGGWSCEGISWFNDLYKLVHKDRACPQAAAMERKLLAFCSNQGGGVGCADREEGRGTAIAGPGVVDVLFVEAAWDLDD
jgi:hypothetical protein